MAKLKLTNKSVYLMQKATVDASNLAKDVRKIAKEALRLAKSLQVKNQALTKQVEGHRRWLKLVDKAIKDHRKQHAKPKPKGKKEKVNKSAIKRLVSLLMKIG